MVRHWPCLGLANPSTQGVHTSTKRLGGVSFKAKRHGLAIAVVVDRLITQVFLHLGVSPLLREWGSVVKMQFGRLVDRSGNDALNGLGVGVLEDGAIGADQKMGRIDQGQQFIADIGLAAVVRDLDRVDVQALEPALGQQSFQGGGHHVGARVA